MDLIKSIAEIVAAVIALASILIKIFPVLDKNNKLLPIIKWIANWLALNKNVTDADRPK